MTARHILLIDDEPDIRTVVAFCLQSIGGWRVSSASGGGEGIEMARLERPDAILLDVMMPGLDGPGTLRRLLADPRTRGIPVIFLTAKVQSADRRAFARLGVTGTLTKPFDPLMLSDQITALLTGSDDTP